MTEIENTQTDLHSLIDKLEHELRSLEFNRPYDSAKIRELTQKVRDLKVKDAESELVF
jgi:hypothetical protein|tara:strand:+ start:1078 stop:1251 length:174 start_codon:yes stop_codon:yes gene_type:complete